MGLSGVSVALCQKAKPKQDVFKSLIRMKRWYRILGGAERRTEILTPVSSLQTRP